MRAGIDLHGRSLLDLCTGSGVVCNPPYVPTVSVPTASDTDDLPDHLGPAWAWDAGPDGRMVLDPVCAAAPELLARDGTLLIVQSELADSRKTLLQLRSGGLRADIVAAETIPFGPVMQSRAQRLEAAGAIGLGQRDEQLLVIRADKP